MKFTHYLWCILTILTSQLYTQSTLHEIFQEITITNYTAQPVKIEINSSFPLHKNQKKACSQYDISQLDIAPAEQKIFTYRLLTFQRNKQNYFQGGLNSIKLYINTTLQKEYSAKKEKNGFQRLNLQSEKNASRNHIGIHQDKNKTLYLQYEQDYLPMHQQNPIGTQAGYQNKTGGFNRF